MSEDPRLAELAERRRWWMRAVADGDLDAHAELVTPGVVWVPLGGGVVTGRDGFRAWLEPLFRDFDYTVELSPSDVALAGDWAVERGRFVSHLTSRVGGPPGDHNGQYVAVWHRSGGGQWRIDRYLDVTGTRA